MTRTDATGETLDGSKHNYTLTFSAGQLPPVNAFWSVTMYDGKTQLLVENPIGRYLINSPMLPGMKKNPDGSLTLYIRKDSPGKAKEANWLPAPNDSIYLVMRLYWPKTEAPSVLPAGNGSWRPTGHRAGEVKCPSGSRDCTPTLVQYVAVQPPASADVALAPPLNRDVERLLRGPQTLAAARVRASVEVGQLRILIRP